MDQTLKIECKGVGNWFNCIRCPNLCTRQCPLEDEDAFNRFAQYISHRSSGNEKEE